MKNTQFQCIVFVNTVIYLKKVHISNIFHYYISTLHSYMIIKYNKGIILFLFSYEEHFYLHTHFIFIISNAYSHMKILLNDTKFNIFRSN